MCLWGVEATAGRVKMYTVGGCGVWAYCWEDGVVGGPLSAFVSHPKINLSSSKGVSVL